MFVSKYSDEDKKRWMEEFKNNEKSVKAYAKEIGIPASTLKFWLKKEVNENYKNSFGKIRVTVNEETTKNLNNKENQIKYIGSKITIILEKGFDKKFLEKVVEVLVNDK